MKITNIQVYMTIVEWHDEWEVLYSQMMVLAENINKTFAHITIDAALYRIINRWNAMLYLKQDIKEPFRIGIKMFPMGNEHIVTN